MEQQPILPEGSDLEGFFQAMIHAAPMPMFVVAEGRCVYGNERFIRLRGCGGADCTTCGLERLLDESDKRDLTRTMASLQPGEAARMSLQLMHEDGRQTAIDLALSGLEIGGKNVALGVISEKTEKERIRRLMDRLAFHDTLTELPNRVLLFDRINQSLSRFSRDGSVFVIAVLDLDGFKEINDSFGHASGDVLLKAVAQRLTNAVRNVDTVARLGGDEFALILQGVENEDEADSVLRKIIAEITRPFELNGGKIRVGASVGVAFCPQDGASIHELLGRADYAMYEAKRKGGSRYQISDGQISDFSSRLELEPLIDVVKLGFDVIDEQHEEIEACIRGILRSLPVAEGKGGLGRRAEYLLHLTEEHFRTEEELMLRHGVSGQEGHRFAHNQLLQELKELLPNHDGHGLTVMTHSFKDWLIPHIQTQDADLVFRLKAAGVTGR